jgi:hypothetical protein
MKTYTQTFADGRLVDISVEQISRLMFIAGYAGHEDEESGFGIGPTPEIAITVLINQHKPPPR